MKKIISLLLVLTISYMYYLFPIMIVEAADNMQLTLSCTNNTNQTDNVTCEIMANTNGKTIKSLSFKYDVDSSLKYSTFDNNIGSYSRSSTTINISNAGVSGNNIKIGTLKFRSTSGSSGTKTIRLQNINYTDNDNNYYTHSQISDSVRITLSTKRDITSLNISSGTLTPTFKSTVYNYRVDNYKEDSITINAEHNGSKITGVGTHKLSLGENVINLVVTSQSGSTKTYKITVNRIDSRSSDTALSNIKLSNGEINFDPSVREYNIEVTTAKVEIDVEKNISSQKVEIQPDKVVELGYDEMKEVIIKVTAESGKIDQYKINLKRIQSQDTSLNFKTFKINGNDFELNEENNIYNLSVANSVTDVDFEYELEDNTSTVEITGNENLVEGTNEVVLTVKNTKEEEKKYTFWINRKENVDILDNDLESIILELDGNKKEIYVAIKEEDENKLIYKDVLNKLAKTDKKLIYEILNKNDGIEYSIILQNIDDREYTDDIDISIDKTSTNGDVKALVDKSNFLFIKENNIKLPGGVKLKIFVGDTFKDNTKLYLYKYNGKLTMADGEVKVKKGFVTFDVDSLSSLVITDYNKNKNAKVDKIENKPTNKPNKLFVGISLLIEFSIIAGLVIYIIINKIKMRKMNINI